ncbi:uncharacterized protein LOC134838253 [Culicoides brevitarsis]|uniref:uncharacterized protein LOC134838253 n=1 Tax=Culicoides brevitarsis TaxID=469753 RepID=UPI00307B931B
MRIKMRSIFAANLIQMWFVCVCSSILQRGCQIKVTDKFKPRQPLFLSSDLRHILLPKEGDGVINIAHGAQIGVCCPEFCEMMECLGNTTYQTPDGTEMDLLDDFTCTSNFEPHILHTNTVCSNKGTLLRVGFDLFIAGAKKFRRLYDVCYDMEASNPIFVRHEFSKTNLKQQPNVDCPDNWKYRGYFGGINANNRYTKRIAFDSLRVQLNRAKAEKLIDVNSAKKFLARGHLAPKGDFVFAPKKLITCHLINAAPQWQSINNGNWSNMEDGIKKIVKNNPDYILEIFTGTFGIFAYDNVPLYLIPGNPDKIPIPKAFYKIIHVIQTDEWFVIVSVNNPYIKRESIENRIHGYTICNDICGQKYERYYKCDDKQKMEKSKKAEKAYIEAGYMYMCDLNDFLTGLRQHYQLELNLNLSKK